MTPASTHEGPSIQTPIHLVRDAWALAFAVGGIAWAAVVQVAFGNWFSVTSEAANQAPMYGAFGRTVVPLSPGAILFGIRYWMQRRRLDDSYFVAIGLGQVFGFLGLYAVGFVLCTWVMR